MRIVHTGLVVVLGLSFPAAAAERAIDKEVVVPASLEKVWESWTTREGIRGFFAPDAVIEPRVGGAFTSTSTRSRSPARAGPTTCASWPCSR
jgi:uncharacterized protein YndB with AHSA1/START domain